MQSTSGSGSSKGNLFGKFQVPFEIIQAIFKFCCGRVVFEISQHDRSQSGTTQVALSLVCSRWRSIALNTGMLWADVAVEYNAGHRGSTPSFQIVRNWLNRAGTVPIDLSIMVNSARVQQIAEISQTLLSSFHFKHLVLHSTDCSLLVPTSNLYHLKTLDLLSWTLRELPHLGVFPHLPEMPSLEELHLSWSPGDFGHFKNIYSIPWHQLRVFSIGEAPLPSSQMLLRILQRCKSLVECELSVSLAYHRQHVQEIVLQNLESLVLQVYFKGPSSADPIIQSLTLPNLKSLDIRHEKYQSLTPLDPKTIVMMAQRSGFKHLTKFSLTATEKPVDVRALLESLPALEIVNLEEPITFQPGAFDDLSTGTIGRRLEEIHFGIMSEEEIVLLLESVGKRHENAKTMSDIRPFTFVTATCTRQSDLESLTQRAEKCRVAFNANVQIFMDGMIRIRY